MPDLTFAAFREANVRRCETVFHTLAEYSGMDWGCCLAGEVGELCNLLKKRRRGDQVSDQAIAGEIGDVIAYLDLLAARLGIDLARAAREKFNRKSAEFGTEIVIP